MKKWFVQIVLSIIIAVCGFFGVIFLAPDLMTSVFVNAERSMASLERKRLQLTTGEVITYLESARSDAEGKRKETIVLLHGFGSNKDIFVRAARHLTDDYHVILPDLVGFGESTRQLGLNYTSQRQAYRLRQFLIEKRATHAHIGGNSMGGHVALAYVAKYPKLTKSLWLLNPGGFWSAPQMPALKGFGKSKNNPLMVTTPEDYVALYQLTMHQPPFVPTPVLKSMAKASVAFHELEYDIARQLSADAIEQRAKTIKLPTLLVWGKEDQLLHADTVTRVKALMPQTKIIMMDNVGHMPMVEVPKQAVTDYVNFLQSISAQHSNQ